MDIQTWLTLSTKRLKQAGIATASLDSLVLLEDLTKKDRAWLRAHGDSAIDSLLQPSTIVSLNEQVTARADHVPLAYIRHKSEFYGRDFYIDERVLEPRPESETIIELLKQLQQTEDQAGANPLSIVDVGTGSGMLAITAKLELPAANVIAIDIDAGCLAVAEQNARDLQVAITLLAGDLLEPLQSAPLLPGTMVLVCNLPYVPDKFEINLAAIHEPRLAIFGGPDGLDVYRRLFSQIRQLRTKPMHLLCESLPPQHQDLARIAKQYGYVVSTEDDFIQLFSYSVPPRE